MLLVTFQQDDVQATSCGDDESLSTSPDSGSLSDDEEHAKPSRAELPSIAIRRQVGRSLSALLHQTRDDRLTACFGEQALPLTGSHMLLGTSDEDIATIVSDYERDGLCKVAHCGLFEADVIADLVARAEAELGVLPLTASVSSSSSSASSLSTPTLVSVDTPTLPAAKRHRPLDNVPSPPIALDLAPVAQANLFSLFEAASVLRIGEMQ
jgi:hypothetical protein